MEILNKKLGQSLLASAGYWIAQLIFVSLLYMSAGAVFGALSDLSNALAVALMAPLLFALYRLNTAHSPFLNVLSLLIGTIGIILSSGASFLIFFSQISFIQSLPPVIGGMGLAGLGLLIAFYLARDDDRMSAWARKLGLVMGTGLTAILLLFAFANPAQMWSGGSGFFGNPLIFVVFIGILVGYFAYPIWAIKYGRELTN